MKTNMLTENFDKSVNQLSVFLSTRLLIGALSVSAKCLFFLYR